jgi:hypothetical protein
MTGGKIVGILKAIKPADVKRPEIERAEQRLTAHMGPVDFYNLVVPRGSRINYIIVGVGHYCIEVDHEGKKYYFMVSELGLTDPDVIEEVPPERCRPRY